MRLLKYILFLASFTSFFAQPYLKNKLKFDRLTSQDGLSHNVIYCLFQDSRGFIWIGTQDGLSRYDGYEFKVYRQKPFDTLSLQDNLIQAIVEDEKGDLWIGTQNGGLFKFSFKDETFSQYKFDAKNKKSLGSNRIWYLFIDSKKRLIIGHSKGFDVYDDKNDWFNRYFDEYTNNMYAVNCILEDETNFWFGTWGDGLYKLDKDFKLQKKFKVKSDDFRSIGTDRIKTLIKDEEGFIWIGGNSGGLNKFDPVSETFVRYEKRSDDSFSISSNYILSLLDCGKYLWVGTHNGGLNLFEKKSGKFYRNLMSDVERSGISDNWVSALMKDLSGIIWIGTGNGVNIYRERKQIFQNITKENSGLLVSNTVNCIEQDRRGNLWVGSWNGGISVIDLKNSTAKIYRYSPNLRNTLTSDIVWVLLEDKYKDLMYIGTYRGLCVFDYNKNSIFNFDEYFQTQEKLSYNNISALVQDQEGNLYIGTWGGGIFYFDSKDKTLRNLFMDMELMPFIEDNVITSLYIDLSYKLWIGTNSSGLYVYDLRNGFLKSFKNNPRNKKTISSNSIRGIFQDSDGDIWIGTNGGGINKFIQKTEEFISYTTDDGLPNNTVYGFEQDSAGYIWFSTNNGVSRFDKSSMNFLNFYAEDGLTGPEFYNGIKKLKDGRIVFGAISGLNIVSPEYVKINAKPPKIHFISFKVYNKEKYGAGFLKNGERISLDYEEKVFSISFAALDFCNSQRNSYIYMLEGFDKRWIDAKNNRTVVYTNLSPGKYAFRVKAANPDGAWNEQGIVLFIDILPPFYMTYWFAFLSITIIILLAYFVHKTRINIIKKQNEVLERMVEIRTAELKKINQELLKEINEKIKYQEILEQSEKKLRELNASKDKFFSIIAHDLKNPFNALIGLSSFLENEIDTLTKEEIKKFATNIGESSRRLFELLQNLLHWSAIQINKIEPKLELLETEKIFRQVYNNVKLLAQERKVNLKYDKDNLFFLGDKMMTILSLQNLVVNAIKFSYEGEEVNIKAEEAHGKVLIKVIDKGPGIKSEVLNNLFKIDVRQNISSEEKTRGTGLGLILCKEFMKLQNGDIIVETEPGKGSTFTLVYPKS